MPPDFLPAHAITCAEMRALEERAFADGITAEALMEEAGEKIAAAVRQFAPRPGRCVVFFGKGNNGGDALVAARVLGLIIGARPRSSRVPRLAGWQLELRPAFDAAQRGALTTRKHAELLEVRPDLDARDASHGHDPLYPLASAEPPPLIILDGLLGIGAGGALREPIRSAAQEINRLRSATGALVFALDLPTGLDADTGAADADAVRADYTLTIGAPKRGLLADAAINHVGRLAVLPLAALTARMTPGDGPRVAFPAALQLLWPRRRFDTHKGDCGRVGIVAGSPGFSGAAVMCAEAALHAGAGLVTLYVPAEIQSEVAARIAPEVMVQIFRDPAELLARKHDVLAVGPGLGRARDAEIIEIIRRAPQPAIIDADALNALAAADEFGDFAGPRLFTPHPGEMERLMPDSLRRPRAEVAEEFAARHPVTLLLKGARTIVAERGRPLSYNTTGTPGMATGGMGDVLTGVCAALAGQGLDLYNAARLGAQLCGRAAELALLDGDSEESLSATHVIAHLGAAFRALREAGY